MRVSVVGGGSVSEDDEAVAEELGGELARRGHTVVCGGLGGTMEAVCRGAKRDGGTTIGVLPTDRPADANDFVDVPIATGLGHARNALVAMNGEGVIALPGSAGTLTELGFAQIYDRPVVGIGTHDLPWVTAVDSPTAAVETLERLVDGARTG